MAQSLLFDAIEAVWAEAISQSLLCMEGAPGFCPSHLETHHMHYASLASGLCLHTARRSLCSLLSGSCICRISLLLDRPYQEAPKANARPWCGVYNSNTGPLCQGWMLSALFEFLGVEFGRTQIRGVPKGFLRDRCPLHHFLALDL